MSAINFYIRKKKKFLLATFLLFSFNLLQPFCQDVPEDLKAFLNKFSAAVLAHNTEQVMALMDADYKKEQHDAFLKGDTQQFLDKFFCGYDPADGERYECIKFNEVIKLEHTSTIPDVDLYIVLFHVTDSDSKVEVTWIVSAITEDGKTNFGMVGTYG
jgi:hypothetical protein